MLNSYYIFKYNVRIIKCSVILIIIHVLTTTKTPINVIAKEPVPIRCPVAGVFQFKQTGDIEFKTRILGGVTDSPRPEIHCMHSVSSLQVCDSGQKEMVIDAEYCLSTDTYGRPVDIYSIELLRHRFLFLLYSLFFRFFDSLPLY